MTLEIKIVLEDTMINIRVERENVLEATDRELIALASIAAFIMAFDNEPPIQISAETRSALQGLSAQYYHELLKESNSDCTFP